MLKAPKKILVVVTLRIGDVLLATPLIRSLRKAYPDAKIDALVFLGTEGILQRNPDIDRVITVPTRPRLLPHLRLAIQLFRRYDLALTGLLGDRPTLYSWIAGKTRFGMQDGSEKERWKQYLLTGWAKFDHINTHTVLTNLELTDLLGIDRSHEVVARWSAVDEQAVFAVLPFEMAHEKFAVLHLSPKFPYKMWNKDGWIALGQWFAKEGVRCVLTGSNDPEELLYIDGIFNVMPPKTVNASGKLTLSETAFLISRACCFVGPDTAVTHMAAAVGTPTVALYGPSNLVKWGPWPKGFTQNQNPWEMRGTQRVNNVVVVQGEADCVPCMQEGCDRHRSSISECLQRLPYEKVVSAIQANISPN